MRTKACSTPLLRSLFALAIVACGSEPALAPIAAGPDGGVTGIGEGSTHADAGADASTSASDAGAPDGARADGADATSPRAPLSKVDAYIKASHSAANAEFGVVALSGDGNTMAVGAIAEASCSSNQSDTGCAQAGAVYVFRLSGSAWTQEAYVKASNPGAGDKFGSSIALSTDGSTLAIGAVGEASCADGVGGVQTDNGCSHAGAAYIFRRNASAVWTQEAYLKASHSDASDWFGARVALSSSGDELAVSAIGESSCADGTDGDETNNGCNSAGAVYVFKRGGAATWTKHAYLKASNSRTYAGFGDAIALSSDGLTLAVGSSGESSCATGLGGNQADTACPYAGAVYLFHQSGAAAWSQVAYVKASTVEPDDRFGGHLALSSDGSTMAVSATLEGSCADGIGGSESDNACKNAGAVFVFHLESGSYVQRAYVKASNSDKNDLFGKGLALSGDGARLAVGAQNESSCATGLGGSETNNGCEGAGAVYVFRRNAASTWTQESYVKASNTEAGDSFGYALALSGDGKLLAVGANLEDSCADGLGGSQTDNACKSAGAVYVFR
ncbi:MAG: hypothetical protein U0174_24990 [Polyangiaceae bacterium]